MSHPAYFWIGFHLLIILLLTLDLGVFHRKGHVMKFKEALLLSGFWIAISLGFNLFIYFQLGSSYALQFFTGYLIEKSLSVDNLFLFLIIFLHFKTPKVHQHKILFWGILGALISRLTLILVGVVLIERFHFLFYVLGAILLISGVKFLLEKEKVKDPSEGVMFKMALKLFPVSKKDHGEKFVVRERGKWKVTTLFITLFAIECTDIILALDSIPAIFAITTDPFIVYTSNVFAILGLRALYFVLASSLQKLHYFKMGLASILIFVGAKMVFADIFSISVMTSLLVIVTILTVTVFASLKRIKRV